MGSGGVLGGQTGSSVITAAGAASSYPDGTRTEDGSWLSDSSTVILGTDLTGATGTYTTDVDYQAPGQSPVTWFDPTDPLGANRGTGFGASNETFFSNQPVVDPTSTYMAVVEKSSYSNNATAPQLQIYKLNGGPPAAPTLVGDYNSTDTYGFLNPQWSGDGSELAWYDSTGEQLLETTAITSCPTTRSVRMLPGVSQASFGPAPNAPAPLPPTTVAAPPPPKTAPVPTFSAASLSIGKSLKKAALLKTGIKTTLHCNAACAYAVALGVNHAAARKLGLTNKKKGPVSVGARSGKFAGGRLTVTVKLYAKALKALRRSRLAKLSLIVAVAVRGADGKRVDHTYGVTIRR